MLFLGLTLSPVMLLLVTVLLLAGCCAAWLPNPSQRAGGSGESLSAACVCITSAVGMCVITAVTTPRSTCARAKHSSECAPPMPPPQEAARPAPFAPPSTAAPSPVSRSRAKKRRRSKNSQATTLSTSPSAVAPLLPQPAAGESSLESSDSSDDSATAAPARVTDLRAPDNADDFDAEIGRSDMIEPDEVQVCKTTDIFQVAEANAAADTDTAASSEIVMPETPTSSLFSHPYNVYPCLQTVNSVAAVTPLCACCNRGHPRQLVFSYRTPNVSCTNCTAACGIPPASLTTQLQALPPAPSLPLDADHFHDTLSSTPQTRTYKEVISPRIAFVSRAGVVGAQTNAFAQQHRNSRPATQLQVTAPRTADQTIGIVPSVGSGAMGVLGHTYSLFGVGELQRLLTV